MPDDDPIGSQEACAILNIDRSTLSRWVAAGKLTPLTKLPGSRGAFVFHRADIDALNQGEQAAAS